MGYILTPVDGYSGMNTIGYWDETDNIFLWKDEKSLCETIDLYKRDPTRPLKVQVNMTMIDGKYHTFRTFGEVNERTIINIIE